MSGTNYIATRLLDLADEYRNATGRPATPALGITVEGVFIAESDAQAEVWARTLTREQMTAEQVAVVRAWQARYSR